MLNVALCLLFSAAPPVDAVESRALAFTTTSLTIARGTSEPQVWLTDGVFRRPTELFNTLELRVLLGHGFTDSLEALVGFEVGLTAFPQSELAVTPVVTAAVHARLLDDVVVVSAVAETWAGPRGVTLGARATIERALGTLLLAANLAAARDLIGATPGIDGRLEETLAIRQRVSERLAVGVEVVTREAFIGSVYQDAAWFVGPSFSWNGRGAWLTLTALAQVAADKPASDRGNGEPLEVRDHERFMLRLAMGLRESH